MQKTNKIIIFSAMLILVSILSIFIRSSLNGPESIPSGDSIWELHWEFTLDESIPESVIRLATPIDSQNIQVFEQNISVQGMHIRRSRLSKDGTREIVARVTKKENVAITVDFAVHASSAGIPHFVGKKDNLNTERRQLYTNSTEHIPSNHEKIRQIMSGITENADKPKMIFDSIFEYCTQEIKTFDIKGANDVLNVLEQGNASVLGKARLLTTLTRSANIPARIVMGLILEESTEAIPHYWVEINLDGEWLAYDPSEGYANEVPYNYLAVRKNGENFIILPGTMLMEHTFLEIKQRDVTIDLLGIKEKNLSDILNLNRLSLSTRLTLAFLLLLPIGALFTVFVRQMLGPEVYGVFTPTFIAMAFSQVGWKTGVILLFLVTTVGIIGRSFTPKIGLNRVSRLTIVFILVAVTMIFSVSLMVYYGIVPDGSIVLLPIVILTFMIDRIYRLADSDGVKVALTRLFWTFLVSAIVVSFLQMDIFGLWLLKYPEAHLVTAALVILISLYKGQKWMNIAGLGWMLEPKKIKETKANEPTL